MKAVLALAVAIILGLIVFRMIEMLLAIVVIMAIKVAVIALFCAVVYWIFKAMSADKQRI